MNSPYTAMASREGRTALALEAAEAGLVVRCIVQPRVEAGSIHLVLVRWGKVVSCLAADRGWAASLGEGE